jgi:predicted RNA-binding protein
MCLSKAYVEKDGRKQFLMTDIASVKVNGSKLVLKTLFGEQQELTAKIIEIDFTANCLKLQVAGECSFIDNL